MTGGATGMSHLAPQLVLAAGALAAIVVSLLAAPRPRHWRVLSVGTLLAALALASRQWPLAATLAAGTTLTALAAPLVVLDPLGAAWQVLLYAAALPLAILGRAEDEVPVVLLLGSVCGMGLLAVAGNLLTLFVALELMSLPAYLLVWKWSRGERGNEAAVKYFFVGATAGALFLMGMALEYASAGEGLALPGSSAILHEVAVALMGAAALFKVGAVPLHFWIPDVYEASRPELAGFFSTAMKGAAVLLLLRVAGLAPESAFVAWLPAIGAATAVVGALLAWRQRDLQRLLAYSSVSHAGVLVLGAAAWALDGRSPAAARALFFYLAAYVFMSNGAFAFLGASGISRREELAGYAAGRPAPAAALAAILLSLGGIPPLAGFFAKFFVFWEAFRVGLYVPVVVAGLASLVALGYYLGLVRDLYFEAPAGAAAPAEPPGWRVLAACATASVVLGLAPWLLRALGLGGSP